MVICCLCYWLMKIPSKCEHCSRNDFIRFFKIIIFIILNIVEARTKVKSSAGLTSTIAVRVGLHQGSSLSPYRFDLVMDILGRGSKEQPHWCILLADDIVPCSTRREEVKRQLEEWRKAIEERGLKISRKKTEYWSSSEQQDLVIWLEGEVKRVKTFKYLGSTLAEDG